MSLQKSHNTLLKASQTNLDFKRVIVKGSHALRCHQTLVLASQWSLKLVTKRHQIKSERDVTFCRERLFKLIWNDNVVKRRVKRRRARRLKRSKDGALKTLKLKDIIQRETWVRDREGEIGRERLSA